MYILQKPAYSDLMKIGLKLNIIEIFHLTQLGHIYYVTCYLSIVYYNKKLYTVSTNRLLTHIKLRLLPNTSE